MLMGMMAWRVSMPRWRWMWLWRTVMSL